MEKDLLVLPSGVEICSGDTAAAGIQQLQYTERVNTGDDLTLGSTCAACIEADILTHNGSVQIHPGDELAYYTVAEDATRKKIGIFIAEKPAKKSANVYAVTAYDRITKSDVDMSDWVADLSGWPYTLLSFAGMVCTQCGLELANTSLPNGDYLIQRFSASDLTGRQLLQWIGEACGRYVHCNADGAVEFAWYTPSDNRITADGDGVYHVWDGTDGVLNGSDALMLFEQVAEAHAYTQGGLSYEDYQTAAITRVQIRQSDSDVGAVYPDNGGKSNTYVIQGNYLLLGGTPEGLSGVAQTIYNTVKDVRYTPCKVAIWQQNTLRAGNIITIKDSAGSAITCYIMQRTVSGGSETLECTGNSSRACTTAVNRQSYKDIRGKMLEISTTVEGLSVKASNLEGDYSELSQTVDQISSRVSASALGNLIQYPNFSNNPTGNGISTNNGILTMVGGGNRTNRSVYIPLAADSVGSVLGQKLTFTIDYKVTDTVINAHDDSDSTDHYWYIFDARIYVYTASGILTWDHYNLATAVSADWITASISLNIPDNASVTAIKGALTLQGATGTVCYRNPAIGFQTEEMYTELKQTVDALTLSAVSSGSSSTITLKSGSIVMSSADIVFSGLVTFEDLSTGGSTKISGDNITAGTITGASVHFDLTNGRLYSKGITSTNVVFATILDSSGLALGDDPEGSGNDPDDPGGGSSGTNVIGGKMGLYCARYYGERTCGALLLSAVPDPSEDYQGHAYVFGTGDAEFSGNVQVLTKLFAQNLTYGTLFGASTVWRTITLSDGSQFTALCKA